MLKLAIFMMTPVWQMPALYRRCRPTSQEQVARRRFGAGDRIGQSAVCRRLCTIRGHQSSDQRNRPEKLAKTDLWISFFRARPRKFFDDKVIGLASDTDVDNSTGHYLRLKI
jgi:hypothetical protein